MKDLFVERGVPAKLIHVLHNPLDLDHFKPDDNLRQETRKNLGLSDGDFLVGYVGAIHPGKGIYILHQAMEKVMSKASGVYMLWIGAGVDEMHFNETINGSTYAARNIRKGYSVDVRPWYAAMDLLAVPSIEYDTFGRVSIEAQACGTPVFGSRLGGIVETLDEGVTGRILPPGDVDAWTEAIGEIIEEKNGQLSLKRDFVARNFAPDSIARKFIDILENTSE